MHEYEQLYRRWRQYRLKRGILFLLGAAFLGAGGYYLYDRYAASLDLGVFKKEQAKPQVSAAAQANKIEPSFAFEQKLKKLEKFRSKKPAKKKSEKKSGKKHPKKRTQKPALKEPQAAVPSGGVTFVSQNKSVESLQEAYMRKPSFELALMIAKKYYARGEYDKSLDWAIKANELDKRNEESWILFAKSSYRLGKKEQAIDALVHFIRETGSRRAKELLRMLIKGEK